MITKEQALEKQGDNYKYNKFVKLLSGGKRSSIIMERTGKTKLWDRQPKKFVIPVKIGKNNNTFTINNENAHEYECM